MPSQECIERKWVPSRAPVQGEGEGEGECECEGEGEGEDEGGG